MTTRWRYTLRPVWLRVLINRAWPGRWTQQEIDEIKARAARRAAWFRENVE